MKIKLLSKQVLKKTHSDEDLYDMGIVGSLYTIRVLKALAKSQTNGYILVEEAEETRGKGTVYSNELDMYFSKEEYEKYDEKSKLIDLFKEFIKLLFEQDNSKGILKDVIKEVERSLEEEGYAINIFDAGKEKSDTLLNFVRLLDNPIHRRKRDPDSMLSEAIELAKKILEDDGVDLSLY